MVRDPQAPAQVSEDPGRAPARMTQRALDPLSAELPRLGCRTAGIEASMRAWRWSALLMLGLVIATAGQATGQAAGSAATDGTQCC